jgi:hypothetical protein
MSEWFDRLAMRLAGGGTRRDALKWMGGLLAGGLLGVFTGKARADDPDDDDDDDDDEGNEASNRACRQFCASCPKRPKGVRRSCKRRCRAFLRQNPTGKLCGTCTATQPFLGCPTGTTCCTPTGAAAICTNTSSDPLNCGACGTVCPTATPTCCSGTCVNTLTDNNNCGTCGTKCATGTTCTAGKCV